MLHGDHPQHDPISYQTMLAFISTLPPDQEEDMPDLINKNKLNETPK